MPIQLGEIMDILMLQRIENGKLAQENITLKKALETINKEKKKED